MPIEGRILSDLKIIVTEVSGVVTDEDSLKYIEWMVSQKDFQSHFSQVVDTSRVRKNFVTTEGLMKVAAVNPFDANTHVAYVVGGYLEEAYCNMYAKTIKDNKYFLVTDSMNEAMTWLKRKRKNN